MKSTDGGTVWTTSDIDYYIDNGEVISDPNNDAVFWSGGNHYNGNYYVMAVSKTTDTGETWMRYELSNIYGMTYALAVDPSNSDIIYAGGSVGSGPALRKTTDGGVQWSDFSSGLTGTVLTLTINPSFTSIIYAGTVDGVFRSTDGGTNWTNIGLSNVKNLLFDPNTSNTIYAATESSGVNRSINGGDDWHELNEGLDTVKITCLGINPGVYLFAGTAGYGIYRLIPDFEPPVAPTIVSIEKTGVDSEDVLLLWNRVTTDTLGNAESVDCYRVYRDTVPDFVPDAMTQKATVMHPETTYTDSGALTAGESYYYLVETVDSAGQRSKKSNMGYKFNKLLNENPNNSDRNWVSLPFNSEYDSVRDLTDELCPLGVPIQTIYKLDPPTQYYYGWYWLSGDFWYGDEPPYPGNFAIVPGQMYEMIAGIQDSTVVIVGWNDPDGLIHLNENPANSDRNWVSIPYNAVYQTVSDITSEYCPLGIPVSTIYKLDEATQYYYGWYWLSGDFWYGDEPPYPGNFAIVPGTGYEFINGYGDTTWNPTEYSNEAVREMVARRQRQHADVEMVQIGEALESDRAPVWVVESKPEAAKERRDYADAKAYMPVTERRERAVKRHGRRVPHVVRAVDVGLDGFEDPVLTVYRPDKPYDVLTEQSAGSLILRCGSQYLVQFNVGNFRQPWQDGEEVILIIEAVKPGRGYYRIVKFKLDESVDVQVLTEDIVLLPIPEPVFESNTIHWSAVDNDNVIGYSLYRGDERLNNRVIVSNAYRAVGGVDVRLVVKGGYETVYGSQGSQGTRDTQTLLSYAFRIVPNPFVTQTRIEYAVPQQTEVEIAVYDVSGRRVKALFSDVCKPGYFAVPWNGCDDRGYRLCAGVYFVVFETDYYKKTEKIVLLR